MSKGLLDNEMIKDGCLCLVHLKQSHYPCQDLLLSQVIPEKQARELTFSKLSIW